MEQVRDGNPFRAHDIPALLDASRFASLRKARDSELLDLVLALENACDRARISAIRSLPLPGQTGHHAEMTPRNFGFVKLFTALRCARLELKRRRVSSGRLAASDQPNPADNKVPASVPRPTPRHS
jgi:hypothetical protein